MAVLDSLPEGQPVRVLRELAQMQREIKAPQTFGGSSVVTKLIYSAATYDLEWPPGDTRQGQVIFTSADMTFGGALVYKMYAFDILSLTSEYYTYRTRVGSDNVQRWNIPTNNFGNADPKRMKFYFFAAGTGTFTTNLV